MWCGVLLLGLSTISGGPDPNPMPKPETPKVHNAAELCQKLLQPVNLDKGIDANTPLRDAIEVLQDRYDVTIIPDLAAFKADQQIDNITEQPVQLPRTMGVRLSTVLRFLTAQISGTFLVKADHLEITTLQQARLSANPNMQGVTERALLPLVHTVLAQRPLREALKDLADQTSISVVLDPRVPEKASESGVTATLLNVPLDAAVTVLADTAGLQAVFGDNVIYVTTKANARALEKELAKRRPREGEAGNQGAPLLKSPLGGPGA
jgi:hypothetical protein